MKRLILSIIAPLLLVGFGTVAVNVFAQENAAGRLDLTVSPPVLEVTVSPGQKMQEKFRVRNNATSPVDLKVTAKELTTDQNGQPAPGEPRPGDDYLQWATFSPDTFTAQPSEWTTVTVTLDVPKTAAFGYYYAFSITRKNQVNRPGTAKVNAEVLVIGLVNVKAPGEKAEGQLVSFSPQTQMNEYLPVTFQATIKSTGNVHIKPHGNIFIRGLGQNDLAILDVNPGLGSVLPNGVRTFSASWNDGFLVKEPVMEDGKVKYDAQGRPVTHLAINWNKLTSFRIGRYTASLLMVYDNGKRDQTIEASTSFWVVPYTMIAILIVSLIVIFLIVRFLIRLYIRRELNRQRR